MAPPTGDVGVEVVAVLSGAPHQRVVHGDGALRVLHYTSAPRLPAHHRLQHEPEVTWFATMRLQVHDGDERGVLQ